MEVITRIITAEEDGGTVRHILRSELHFSARAVARVCRAETGIMVNGQRAYTNRILRAGDVLQVETGDHRPPKRTVIPGNWPLPIVWEDGHMLIVNKPANMTAHASNFLPDTPTVAGALAWERGTDFLFHPVSRLDRDTTGLMVVAKSGYVHDLLRRALHTDRFRREYRAICLGRPAPPAGRIAAPIGREESSTVKRRIRPDGAAAFTRYKTLAAGTLPDGREASFVKVLPETGRTHQIRVHMAHIGCPLAGDWLYGREEPELISRPALHSYALELLHPVTGELLRLTAPLPEDMQSLLRRANIDTWTDKERQSRP